MLLLLSGGYRRLEMITTVLVAAVTLFTVVSVVILQWTRFRISLPDLEQGMKLSFPTAALALAFSAFGITGVGASELVAYPYWCIEKGYARSAGAGPPTRTGRAGPGAGSRSCRSTPGSAWSSSQSPRSRSTCWAPRCCTRKSSIRRAKMIPTLSQMYLQPLEGTPLAGLRSFTRVGFLLGAWAVLFKTLYVATAANSRLTADFLYLLGAGTRPVPNRACA